MANNRRLLEGLATVRLLTGGACESITEKLLVFSCVKAPCARSDRCDLTNAVQSVISEHPGVNKCQAYWIVADPVETMLQVAACLAICAAERLVLGYTWASPVVGVVCGAVYLKVRVL